MSFLHFQRAKPLVCWHAAIISGVRHLAGPYKKIEYNFEILFLLARIRTRLNEIDEYGAAVIPNSKKPI